jgi:hypothetical protein
VFVQRTGIRAPADHKSKYKQEIDCGEKKVGEGRVARPGRKTKEVIRFRLNLSNQRSGITG